MLDADALKELRALLLNYSGARARLETHERAVTEAINEIRDVYSRDIAESAQCAGKCEEALKGFAKRHRRDFAADPRSYEVDGWRVGFRKRPDAVKVPRDEESVIKILREKLNFIFVRPQFELDREALLRFMTRETDEECVGGLETPRRVDRLLEDLGISLKSGKDKFFIERA